MILFKPQHVPMILEGRKTQTRRLGKKRWNVGSAHQAKTSLFGERFAWLVITGVRKEKLCDISDEDVRREGYETRAGYYDAFVAINRLGTYTLGELVWVVDFRLVKDSE
jgi:hypothetical protein